ncbi:MAG: hypothetical protein MK171_05850 [Pirellulales bacterium]|nr:hypothetical protein [Pirellulales bacterium]
MYYSLIGVDDDPADLEDIRSIARKWLGKGEAFATALKASPICAENG